LEATPHRHTAMMIPHLETRALAALVGSAETPALALEATLHTITIRRRMATLPLVLVTPAQAALV